MQEIRYASVTLIFGLCAMILIMGYCAADFALKAVEANYEKHFLLATVFFAVATLFLVAMVISALKNKLRLAESPFKPSRPGRETWLSWTDNYVIPAGQYGDKSWLLKAVRPVGRWKYLRFNLVLARDDAEPVGLVIDRQRRLLEAPSRPALVESKSAW